MTRWNKEFQPSLDEADASFRDAANCCDTALADCETAFAAALLQLGEMAEHTMRPEHGKMLVRYHKDLRAFVRSLQRRLDALE